MTVRTRALDRLSPVITGGFSDVTKPRQTIRLAAITGTDKNMPATPASSPPANTPMITSPG